jgi:hypothetical protein
MFCEFGLYGLGANGLSYGMVNRVYDRTCPRGNLSQALAEVAIGGNDEYVTRLNDVYASGFHASSAGSGNRQSRRVRGPEDQPKHAPDIIHYLEEDWIQMT